MTIQRILSFPQKRESKFPKQIFYDYLQYLSIINLHDYLTNRTTQKNIGRAQMENTNQKTIVVQLIAQFNLDFCAIYVNLFVKGGMMYESNSYY